MVEPTVISVFRALMCCGLVTLTCDLGVPAIRGRVVTVDGNPVAGAWVHTAGRAAEVDAYSRADGSFVLPTFPPESLFKLVIVGGDGGTAGAVVMPPDPISNRRPD